MRMPTTCTYLLPIRRVNFSGDEATELASYFQLLREAGCDVILADGSPDAVFAQIDQAVGRLCRHARVDRSYGYINDKVNGIHTGIALSQQEKIILADDDIRYSGEALARIIKGLDCFDVVRPQNFLDPLPWWAKMEAARMLVNRATLRTGDYPGTCAFRKSVMLASGHYDGDVLFDNEEIIRHFAQSGATIDYALDLFVRKRPPTFRKWIEQRPRQAYEDFGLRLKTGIFVALPLVVVSAAFFFGWSGLVLCLIFIALLSILLAWRGRARGAASDYFPKSIYLFAPVWILERGLSTYWALYWWLRRGGYPFGGSILSRGIGRDWRSGGRIASRQVRAASP